MHKCVQIEVQGAKEIPEIQGAKEGFFQQKKKLLENVQVR